MTAQNLRRSLFLLFITPVVVIPFFLAATGYRAIWWETYDVVFIAGLLGLFLVSILFLRWEHRWACAGLIISVIAAAWSFAAPVVVE